MDDRVSEESLNTCCTEFLNVQECDATDDDNSNEVGFIRIIYNKRESKIISLLSFFENKKTTTITKNNKQLKTT